MRRPTYAILTAALLLVPASLLAQQNLTGGPLGATQPMQFDGATWVATWGDVYVPPYTGTLTSYPGMPEITLYCVDYAHDVSVGQTWTANVTNLGNVIAGSSTLANTRLGAAGLGTYENAAFLSSLFDAYTANPSYYDGLYYQAGTTFGNQRGFYSGLAAAIWNLTNPDLFPSASPYVTNPTMAASMGTAIETRMWDGTLQNEVGINQDLSNFDFNNWWILSDVAGANNPQAGTQEFLVHTTVTPEPATYILLLTGIVVLFGITWLQRRHASEMA